MTPFALIAPKPGREAEEALNRFRAAAPPGWIVSRFGSKAWLAMGPGRALDITKRGAWRMIGDVFSRPGAAPSGARDAPQDWIETVWGRYVAVQLGDDGGLRAVMRDPSGALDVVVWQTAQTWIIASSLSDWMLSATRPRLSVDRDRVAGVLQDPTRAWDVSLLRGVESITPGSILRLDDRLSSKQIWRPGVFVDAAARLSTDEACDRLRNRVDEAVQHLAAPPGALAAELSGGLDSSIVASSLRRLDRPVKAWLHSYGAAAESDERAFALPLAERLGVKLDLLARPDAALSLEDLQSLSPDFRPGFNAMDPVNDGIAAARLQALEIDAVLTGKGGDAVFFQAFGEEVFADLWRRRGPPALLSPTLLAVARWEGRSIWSVVRGRAHRPSDFEDSLFASGPPLLPAHPWLEDPDGIGPAKRMQILGMLDGAGFSSPSKQTAVADIRHPLLTQPVLEACLALPAEQLTLGRDRGLARLAFAQRLTPEIAVRRSKGDLTAYYGRLIARSLDVLRPWLLDGLLVEMDLIDRTQVDQVLSADHLIWRGGYRDIMIAAAMESWLRAWRSRLEDLAASQ